MNKYLSLFIVLVIVFALFGIGLLFSNTANAVNNRIGIFDSFLKNDIQWNNHIAGIFSRFINFFKKIKSNFESKSRTEPASSPTSISSPSPTQDSTSVFTTSICTDSDGGVNYDVAGTVIYQKGDLRREYSDTCLTPHWWQWRKYNLEEYLCADARRIPIMTSEKYVCPYGCEDGRCKEKDTTNTCQFKEGSTCADYEVCQGEILSASDTNRCCKGKCELPKSFDWRNKHGENWNSSIKSQGSVPGCTQFGPIAAIETVINLYYNQHLDINLSEQITMSCKDEIYQMAIVNQDGTHDYKSASAGACYGVNNPGDIICYTKTIGIPDENCYPYVDYPAPSTFICDNLCSDYKERMWKVADFWQLLPEKYMRADWDPLTKRVHQELINKEKLKRVLIKYGPVGVEGMIPGHVVSLVGWEELDEGTRWIYKDSQGANHGEQGYGKIFGDVNNFVIGYVETPITSPLNTNYEIKCVDKDSDSFCNWGISETKPSTCPYSCKDERDWDDSNYTINALGLQMEPVLTVPSIPTNLRIIQDTGSSITWSWNNISRTTHYKVYGGENCTDIRNYGATTENSHTLSGFNSGEDFYYRVKACNDVGCSDYSDCVGRIIEATVPDAQISSVEDSQEFTIPMPPRNLTVTESPASSISWSWDASLEATQYELYGGWDCTNFNSYGTITETVHTLSGFNPGQTFYLRIKACNDVGCSDYSDCVEGITK